MIEVNNERRTIVFGVDGRWKYCFLGGESGDGWTLTSLNSGGFLIVTDRISPRNISIIEDEKTH